MRITELTAYHVRIPFRKEVRHASYSRSSTDSIVVSCRFADGTVGWGEGLPRPYVTGDTIESTWEMLEQCSWSNSLGGSWDSLSGSLERLALENWVTAPDGTRECFGNPLRCAVELSILDGLGQLHDLPLSGFVEQIPQSQPIRRKPRAVRYSTAITSMSARKQSLSAFAMRLWGFKQCKVKVGTRGMDDERSLRRLRRILGPRMDLRLDANEAWSVDQLAERVDRLTPFRISSLEQPVPHTSIENLRGGRGKWSVPIMLDESLCSLEDACRAIEQETCDLFNIRLSKCGGFLRSLQLAATAHDAGIGYQLGCQVGETAVLSAAGRHFACAIDGIRFLEGSYDRYLVRESLARRDITFGYGGMARPLNTPGLGIDVDRAAVDRVTVRSAQWRIT